MTKQKRLIIKNNFKEFIRKLSTNESVALESSIKENGCLSPLIVWKEKNILLDGHNRLEICTKLKKTYQISYLSFNSETDAKIWIIKNQFARRNYSTFEKCFLALKLEPLYKNKAEKNKLAGKQVSPEERYNVNIRLGWAAGVSHDTIARVKKIVENVDSNTKFKLAEGKLSINAVYIQIKKSERIKTKAKNIVTNQEEDKADILYTTFKDLVKEAILPKTESEQIWVKDESGKYINTYFNHKLKDPTLDKSKFIYITKSELNLVLKEDSYLLLWALCAILDEAFAVIRKLGFNFRFLSIWNRQDKYGPQFFIAAKRGKGVDFRPDVEPDETNRLKHIYNIDAQNIDPDFHHWDITKRPDVFQKWIDFAWNGQKKIIYKIK